MQALFKVTYIIDEFLNLKILMKLPKHDATEKWNIYDCWTLDYKLYLLLVDKAAK